MEKKYCGEREKPLRLRCAHCLPAKWGLTEPARPEGLFLFAITALLKNLPYFFKKSLYGLDFRRLFCYNS